MKRFFMKVLMLCVAIVLSACGGGGGGNGMPMETMTPMPSPQPSPRHTLTQDFLNQRVNTGPLFGSVVQTLSTGVSTPTGIATTFALDRYTMTVPRADGSTTTLDTDRDIVVEQTPIFPENNPVTNRNAASITVYKEDPHFVSSTVLVEWANGDVTDYLAGGYWMGINPTAPSLEMGAFIDGPDFSTDVQVPIMGTATYNGIATGQYLASHGTDTEGTPGNFEQGEYDGRVQLTADFGDMEISGQIDQIALKHILDVPRTGEGAPPITGPVATDYVLTLNPAPISEAGTFFGEDVTFSSQAFSVTSSRGSFGGSFSNVDDAAGNPRAAAGVNEAFFETAGGTQALLNGVFYGATERFE